MQLVHNTMEITKLEQKLQAARNEMKNIRQQVESMKHVLHKEVAEIRKLLEQQHEKSLKAKSQELPNSAVDLEITDNEPSLEKQLLSWNPIGHIKSIFKEKNGTPRQAGVCPSASASLTIHPDIFSNAHHALEGLHSFSHLWVLFVFHKNNNPYTRAKVKPPRLDGARTGLFSTRCPYRPNPLGMSLCKIEDINGATVYLSGVDMLDGTPVVDIKPYIPEYDSPHSHSAAKEQAEQHLTVCGDIAATLASSVECETADYKWDLQVTGESSSDSVNDMRDTHKREVVANIHDTKPDDDKHHLHSVDVLKPNTHSIKHEHTEEPNRRILTVHSRIDNMEIGVSRAGECSAQEEGASVAGWIKEPPIPLLSVRFTSRAERQAEQLTSSHSEYTVCEFTSPAHIKSTLTEVLKADPRSAYRRNKCTDKLYYFAMGGIHVTCWFDDNVAEVLKIVPQAIDR